MAQGRAPTGGPAAEGPRAVGTGSQGPREAGRGPLRERPQPALPGAAQREDGTSAFLLGRAGGHYPGIFYGATSLLGGSDLICPGCGPSPQPGPWAGPNQVRWLGGQVAGCREVRDDGLGDGGLGAALLCLSEPPILADPAQSLAPWAPVDPCLDKPRLWLELWVSVWLPDDLEVSMNVDPFPGQRC